MQKTRRILLIAFCVLHALPTLAQTRGPGGVAEAAPLSQQAARVALVVGNAAYPGKDRLVNAVNDATDMAALLKRFGFRVSLVTDGDLQAMRTAVDQFTAGITKDGVALFYYAGHGVEVEKKNYLVPISNPPLEYEADAPALALPLDLVLARMELGGAALNMVILDACRNNELKTGARSGGGAGLAAVQAAYGTLVAYATSPGMTASDAPQGRNGLYTGHLLKLMQEPGRDILRLFNDVSVAVSESTAGKQIPWQSMTGIMGDFYFVPPADAEMERRDMAALAPGAPPGGNAGTEAGIATDFAAYQQADSIGQAQKFIRERGAARFAAWRAAADAGSAEAQLLTGAAYGCGGGAAVSAEQALAWYRKAAAQGNANAMVQLGHQYRDGWGVPQDFAQAVDWYRRAAEAGHAVGMYSLGKRYEKGEGVPLDKAEAWRWFQRAAEAGDASGMNEFGMMLFNGDGVSKNPEAAAEWFRKAADLGNSMAMNNLAFLLRDGAGVPQDQAAAIDWLRKAVAAGGEGMETAKAQLAAMGVAP